MWIYAVYRTKDGIVSAPNAAYMDQTKAECEQQQLNRTTDATWLIKVVWLEGEAA